MRKGPSTGTAQHQEHVTKGTSTKKAILDRALALASTRGLEGLSIGELAREVGLSKSGLYAHFGSKEGLELEVLEAAQVRFVETVVRPAIAEPRGLPRVIALFGNWLAWSRADFLPGGCLFVAAAVELDDRPGAARDFLATSQRAWLDTLERAARIAVEEGHFRADLDAEQFAHEHYAILLAHNLRTRLLQDPDTAGRSRMAFARLLADAGVPVDLSVTAVAEDRQ